MAIVTGASSGIGRAIAERLATEGALVVVNYLRSEHNARAVVAGIQGKGGTAVAVQADMRVIADARRLVASTVSQFNRVDILVNNAGKFAPIPFLDTTEADFDALMALHAKGPYFAMQEAAKVMRDHGRIVNISSAGTKLRYSGATAYLGSRGALEQFTQGIAQELAPRGITVNTVAPGFTDTGVLTEPYRQMGVQLSPFKRLGTPEDIAEVVAFLVSEQARWLTGQTIQAGGGIAM
ncbi:SDR family oxidoreductase [Nitrospira lenta]|uniref:SDR family oxidoreductase n=1 Tax=Nitrospira lenta TaxID=1436998 RepID=UPI001FE84975|nr:SDR family oxidoreductase [Nitrospira lenta]